MHGAHGMKNDRNCNILAEGVKEINWLICLANSIDRRRHRLR